MRATYGAGIAALAALYTVAGTGTAHAYIDPGTGSIIIQSVLGAIAAAATFGAFYFDKFKGYVRSFLGRDEGVGDPKSIDGER